MVKPTRPMSRSLSPAQMQEGIRLLKVRIEELDQLDLASITARDDPRIDGIESAIGDTLNHIFGYGTPEYNLYKEAKNLDTARHNYAFEVPWAEVADGFSRGKARSLQLLRGASKALNERAGGSDSAGSRAIRAFQNLDLHPEIGLAATQLYSDGHFANAVEASVKALNGLVRLRSGLDFDGVTLMERAFNPSNPLLKFNSLADQSDRDEQKGFMQMFSGAVSGLRNPRSHKFINDDAERALEFVAFVSLLAKLLDGAQK
jgi:uncharacterized protein (TIGR02391 family)